MGRFLLALLPAATPQQGLGEKTQHRLSAHLGRLCQPSLPNTFYSAHIALVNGEGRNGHNKKKEKPVTPALFPKIRAMWFEVTR